MTEEKLLNEPAAEEVENETADEGKAVRTEQKGEDLIIAVSRSSARLAIKIVIVIVIGVLLAFVAPVLVRWLATFPNEVWYVIGVVAAVIATVVLCVKSKS